MDRIAEGVATYDGLMLLAAVGCVLAWCLGCGLAMVVDWGRGVWLELRATDVREEWR